MLEILLGAFREVEHFLYVVVDPVPNSFHRRGFSIEDFVVSLFPEVQEDEARSQLPDTIDDRVCEGGSSPALRRVL